MTKKEKEDEIIYLLNLIILVQTGCVVRKLTKDEVQAIISLATTHLTDHCMEQ